MTITLVLVLFLIIIFLFRQSSQTRKMDELSEKLNKLVDRTTTLNQLLENSIKEQAGTKSTFTAEKDSVVADKKDIPVPPAAEPVIAPIPKPPVFRPVQELKLPPAPPPPPVEKETEWDDRMLQREKAKPQQGWLKKENMEEFIGGNLANKIGIAVLVLGIAFFVKYAIDKDWINELGRVSIGLLCGALLIGIAHQTRKKYRAFSSVLVGGGLSVLYFSIAFAFHQYHLIGQQAAFGIMVLTTAFAVVLSLYYNRQELAIIALIGGFATPFLASTGNDNYIALFTYLSILCAGMTALSWFRKWPAVNIISMIGSALIFGGWLVDRTWDDVNRIFPYRDGLFFATLFFLLFMAMHTLNNLRAKRAFVALDYMLVIVTQLGYYLAGTVCLQYINHPWNNGIFTLSLGAFNLLLGIVFYRSKLVDRNFSWLLVGISLTQFTFFALTQLNGHEITLFWACESVLLLFLAVKTRFRMLNVSSAIVQALACVSVIFLWASDYLLFADSRPIIFNQVFIGSVVVAGTLLLRSYVVAKYELQDFGFSVRSRGSKHSVYVLTAVIMLFLAGLFEIMHQFHDAFPYAPVYLLFVQLYILLSASVLLRVYRNSSSYPVMLIFANIGALVIVVLCLQENINLHKYLSAENLGVYFLAHWATLPFIFYHVYLVIHFFRNPEPVQWKAFRELSTWLVSIGLLIFLSIELYQINLSLHLANAEGTARWENLFYKAQLSILWGLFGFTLIWLGLRYKYQPLRIISLLLFAITLIKLFLYDIRNIPAGGKIASFILLGVLLLLISFMYQRIKAIILKDEGEAGG